jgi:hypothetical protein
MIFPIDNGELGTDLDCGNFDITNVGSLTPVPINLVATDDPRLTDARVPLDGSVTNASVALDAAIAQDKLNLNGPIPSAWLGTSSTTAARGDLTEYKSNKGVPGGYAALDATGKLPVAQLPLDAGTGTVTSVGLSASSEFSVTGSPVTTSGIIALAWVSVPAGSWFGNPTASSAPPIFTTAPVPPSMVPDLPADKITSGIINAARLPAASGMGLSSASGAVPDPGPTGAATDYLARDMTYKPVPTIGPPYQPTIASPVLTPSTAPGPKDVLVTVAQPGATLLYKITPTTQPAYIEIATGTVVALPTGETLSVYGAKPGYNNSSVVTLAN